VISGSDYRLCAWSSKVHLLLKNTRVQNLTQRFGMGRVLVSVSKKLMTSCPCPNKSHQQITSGCSIFMPLQAVSGIGPVMGD